jgi:NAD(P)-dependent dehydrogenase (short-subunit alcohol dehydrogenase family)
MGAHNLANQVAIITGASRGIGLAAARLMAEQGARVVLTARGADALRQAAQALAEQGYEALALPADVASRADVERVVSQTVEQFGRVDILVNNAGIASSATPLVEITDESWQRLIDVHLTGAFLTCRAVLPHMLRAGYGRIVNISSLMALNGHMLGQRPGDIAGADYTAAKAGLIGLTRALAFEVTPKGITVNAVAPGPVATEIQSAKPKDQLERIPRDTIVGRFGRPEEIAQAVLYLVGPNSGFITGQVISVNGGVWGA